MITIIVVNILIGLVFMLIGILKTNKEFLFSGVIIATMPILGIVLLMCCMVVWAFDGKDTEDGGSLRFQFKKKRKVISLQEYSDLVPVSETLVLNDTKVKKEILITILREDKTKYIESLKEALKDPDVEASHYAAVALVDIKDTYNKALEETARAQYKSKESLEAYVRVLERSIKSGLNDVTQQERLERNYIEVLQRILNTDRRAPFYYQELIGQLMQNYKYDEAYNYCKAFIKDFPRNEEAYFCLINYYYEKRDKKNLEKAIRQLRQGDVVLSREGLNNIRFWIGGL